MPLIYTWRAWAECADGRTGRSVGGNMMEHRQGRWILCAPSSVQGVGLLSRRCRLESMGTYLCVWATLLPPPPEACANRRCRAHDTTVSARSSAIQGPEDRLIFPSLDFLCSTPSLPFSFLLSSQSPVHSKDFT